ncbi:MAG: hypothetical protein Q7S40_20615 [Opitutaceae bacterium]|nr:hypothetical protein [Opitutaceae bacterium]
MLPSDSSDPNRREFFRRVLRYAALAGAGAAGLVLARRGSLCRRDGVCRDCTLFEGCDATEARTARRGAANPRGTP